MESGLKQINPVDVSIKISINTLNSSTMKGTMGTMAATRSMRPTMEGELFPGKAPTTQINPSNQPKMMHLAKERGKGKAKTPGPAGYVANRAT